MGCGDGGCTVYPKKYAHGFVVLYFVVVMQSFIMNSHEVFIHIHQGCFAGTGAIVRLPQCQWSKPVGNGKISQCITTTKHSKAAAVCIFLRIYCICWTNWRQLEAWKTIAVSQYVWCKYFLKNVGICFVSYLYPKIYLSFNGVLLFIQTDKPCYKSNIRIWNV